MEGNPLMRKVAQHCAIITWYLLKKGQKEYSLGEEKFNSKSLSKEKFQVFIDKYLLIAL